MISILKQSRKLLVSETNVQVTVTRSMSALKTLSMRLKSVRNIQKITKSMKMVSASKYTQAQQRLNRARPYGDGAKHFFKKVEIEAPEETPQRLIVAMTSDRGLCGGCHSGIARHIRRDLEKGDSNVKIFCIGDKARTLLRYYYPKNIIMVATDMGRKPPTFQDASLIGSQIWKMDFQFTHGKIIYNKFKSVVSYNITELPLFSLPTVMNSPKLLVYDEIEPDMMQSYMEYSLTSMLFYTLSEAACSEQSARMTAMENATKNAGEMIDKLALTYNRTRQSVITRELIEIISGAAAI